MGWKLASYWVELLGAEVRRIKGRYSTRIIEAGEGEPLLLLHGTGGHAENYIKNIGPLSQHFHVIAMDLLWHGRSQTSGFEPAVLPPLVDQVADVLDCLSLERVHIEGQSLGGWVAMLFALAHPQRVAKLVLTTPMGYVPGGDSRSHEDPGLLALRDSTLAVLRDPNPGMVRQRLERIVADPSIIPDEAVAVRHSFYNDPELNAVQQRLTQHYLGGPEPQAHVVTDELAARIEALTLVYWGDKNFVAPPVGLRLARAIPGGSFFCAENTGHWAQFENHETHNREVLRFLLGGTAIAGDA
ncbi:MAG: alpha/beta fold hydrolase [Burkholderiaceae bacterium]